MKTMALLFLLSVSALVVSAQSPNINQPTLPVAIRSARVNEFSICYEGLGGAPPWQDRFNGPGTLVRLDIGNTSSNPEEFTSNEATFLARMGNARSSVKVTSKALFSIAIKNTGTKRIKALRFQFLFSNLATGAPYATYEKRMRVKIKPGEEKWLSSEVSMRKAPDNLLKAINSGQNKNDIELLLVEYDDGSVWSRP